MTALIYLENNVAADTFGQRQLTLTEMLAAQAAVAMENARLYSHLEEEVRLRTQELSQAHARVLQLERQSTEVQMAGGFAHEMRNALSAASFPLDGSYFPAVPADGESVQEKLRQLLADLRQHVRPEGEPAAQALEEAQAYLDLVLHTVRDSLHSALGVTRQILEYAQAGQWVASDDEVVLAPLVQGIVNEFAMQFDASGIEVRVEMEGSLKFPMRGDHVAVILRNLLANARDAVRGKPAGARTIMVRAGQHTGQLQLAVEDSGAGMDSDTQRHVFEPFYTTKGAEGTGLGLAFCRKLAHVYGGQLEFSSAPNQGTEFRLQLPGAADHKRAT